MTLTLHDTDSIISVFDIKDHVSLRLYVHFFVMPYYLLVNIHCTYTHTRRFHGIAYTHVYIHDVL